MSSAELKKDFDEDAEVWSGEDPLFDNNFKRCEKGGDSLFNFPYSDSELSFNESHGRRSTETDPDSYGKIYPEYGPPYWGEGTETYDYYFVPEEQEEEPESNILKSPSDITSLGAEEQQRKSIFIHSCPGRFSDINNARRSVFGSIFLRTTGRVFEEANLLKTVGESNYNMLQSFLTSFEKILSVAPSDSEKKKLLTAYKQSILRMLENHGIRKTCSDGSIHWDIYPIAQSYLFTIEVDNHIHQTRNLSRIEERILSSTNQYVKLPYEWPTNSVWSGKWESLGMSGAGSYKMPHGVIYNGKMKDGMFHDDCATLTYPNKFKALNCVYEKGVLKDCSFQFPDGLLHEKENWSYCKFPDRRFWSEVKRNLKPAKIAQKTETDPPRKIPAGCYDTNDGFFNPNTYELLSPSGELLRVPLREETIWIRKYCRKGFLQPTGYRPDLFENWFENEPDLIDRILKQHENYRRHKITFDELQQFYADNNLLTPYSKYKKKSNTNLSEKEYVKSIPEPVVIEPSKILKKFKGHKLSVLSEEQESQSSEGIKTEEMSSMKSSFNKKSKSLIKFNVEYQQKFPYSANLRNSKISFRLSEDFVESFNPNDESEDDFQKNILSKLLTPQPIHRPPFQFAERRRKYATTDLKSKCEKKEEIPSRVKSSVILVPEPSRFERKKLSKFMADIIMEAAMKGIIEETEREKNRLLWAKKVRSKKRRINKDHENCIKLLEEIFRTMPEKDEYCDNQLHRTCDFRNLAEDRHNSLKYWGTRTFFLNLEKDDQF